MLKPKLLLLAVVTFVTCASSNLTMTSSFKRLGQLTTGLTYGHIHSSIDFVQLQRAQRLVVQGVMDQLRNSNSANERAQIEAIKPQLDIATKNDRGPSRTVLWPRSDKTETTDLSWHRSGTWTCQCRYLHLCHNGSNETSSRIDKSTIGLQAHRPSPDHRCPCSQPIDRELQDPLEDLPTAPG